MAILNQIRQRSFFLIVVIAMALFSFVLADVFRNTGTSDMNASTVGSYDLDLVSSNDNKNHVIKKLNDNHFDILFLVGQDSLKFKKKNEFVIYIGSHGDIGAENADVILPGSTYTEQDGYFTNLEGRIQKAYKASYPPGIAKEEWEIFNEFAKLLKRKNLFKNKDDLINSMFNYLELKSNNTNIQVKNEFKKEIINIEPVDYYYSNVIARASKTMTDCRNAKIKLKKTGTEG